MKRDGKNKISCYVVNPKDDSELLLVPGGWFWMGSRQDDSEASNKEKPRHLHYVEPFYFAITCVTVKQFEQFVAETRYDAGSDWRGDPPDHPVRYVNWYDSLAYCKWAGLRLPSEAEWELAASGYGALKYPWGDEWNDGRRVCWSNQKGPYGNSTRVFDHPEGASPIGTYQQSGNLWEWCMDAWDGGVYERYAGGDFTIPEDGSRVLRGTSWFDFDQLHFRCASRDFNLPERRGSSNGFRPAMTAVKT